MSSLIKARASKPEDFLPLSQSTLYVLDSLIPGPRHGYAILKDIEEQTAGEVRMAIGNLYVTLKRLLEQGLIERVGVGEHKNERRKVYRITGLGAAVLTAELARMGRVMRTARALRLAGQGL